MPIYDYNGKCYTSEFNPIPTGEFTATVSDPTKIERQALEIAITPGHLIGIQTALEELALIKSIGSSEIKQKIRISRLVYDLYKEGISEFVINELCEEYRKSRECGFFPDHGEFFQSAVDRMKAYTAAWKMILDTPS